ncbi:glycosyltransferase 28 [Ceratobasidium sp. AG-I]|nr:glycosyltransferase 28 [Ceratobasidium sp. AG-I]
MTGSSKCVFVTVGSTKFDELASAVLSPPVLDSLHSRGFSRLVLQCGNSFVQEFVKGPSQASEWSWTDRERNIEISIWKFKPDLGEHFQRADLVISHAGSGTILEVLRFPKPLIVVPNETLLDNHQVELAKALGDLSHLFSSSASGLAKTIETYDPATIVDFPQFDGSKFRVVMDEEMGFA